MHYQNENDRYYLGENPLRSWIWDEEPVESHQWIGNSKEIMSELTKKISDEAKLYTKPIQGKDITKSGEYCNGLVMQSSEDSKERQSHEIL